jgi:hypothetical protein
MWEMLSRQKLKFGAYTMPTATVTPQFIPSVLDAIQNNSQYATFLAKIAGGSRPIIPNSPHIEYIQLMESCWQHKAEDRPSFSEIRDKLNAMKRFVIKYPYDDPKQRRTDVPEQNSFYLS